MPRCGRLIQAILLGRVYIPDTQGSRCFRAITNRLMPIMLFGRFNFTLFILFIRPGSCRRRFAGVALCQFRQASALLNIANVNQAPSLPPRFATIWLFQRPPLTASLFAGQHYAAPPAPFSTIPAAPPHRAAPATTT